MQAKSSLLAIVFSFICAFAIKGQNIPAAGDSATLEIANWNLEWFGKTTSGYGPANDVLQQKHIRDVVQKAAMDIWAFCEVSETKAFDSLMAQCPQYDHVLAAYLPEQKTAVVYRKDMFSLAWAKLIGTANKDSFTTGRYPLEVALIPKKQYGIDTLFLIVLHLKANTGTDSEKMQAYNSRKRSSEWLQMYLGNQFRNRFCMVLGDWNDDLDESIYNTLPSPFTNLQQVGFPFTFLTKKLSDSHISTTTSYPEAIDHQLVSNRLLSWYYPDSTFAWKLDKFINSYSQDCSDHYPVYSLFAFHRTGIPETDIQDKLLLFPHPASNEIGLQGCPLSPLLSLYDLYGRVFFNNIPYDGGMLQLPVLADGVYLLLIENGTYKTTIRMVIQH